MKGHLGPRWMMGIDKQLYNSGLRAYWQDVGASSLTLIEADGMLPWMEAAELIQERIDAGITVPYLLLRHRAMSGGRGSFT